VIILHGTWIDGNFFLWGEKTRETKRRSSARTGADSPYDVTAQDLHHALAGVTLPAAQKAQKIQAFLPTTEVPPKRPVPSSPLIDADNDEPVQAVIAPWLITALPLDVVQSLNALAHVSGKRLLERGLLAGLDLAFWTEALAFAGSLVVRRLYLPAAREEGLSHRAFWEPLVSAEEARSFAVLAGRMPHSARALSPKRSDTPLEQSPEAVLKSFLAAHVDALVRMAESREAKRKRREAFSPHDAWLLALRGDNALIKAEFPEGRKLLESIESWKRPVLAFRDSPYRLCLRLEEPNEQGEPWHLRYLLQSCRDESLLIETGALWDPKSAASRQCAGEGFSHREFLISSFGDAAKLSPPIERSLSSSRPSGAMLSTDEAWRFLAEEAPSLAGRGMVLLLPSWWTGKGASLRLSARVRAKTSRPKSAGSLRLGDIVSFQWEAALGDEPVDRAELERLAELKVPLVRIRGQWVAMKVEEIRQALSLMETRQKLTVKDALHLALAGSGSEAGLQIGQINASGWLGELLSKMGDDCAIEALDEPPGFIGALRPYQKSGLSWLSFLRRWGLGACLADDMGLGKTVQTLAHIQRERRDGETRPVLLVCPTSVVTNWQKEARHFTPELTVLVHHGSGRTRDASFTNEALRHALVISTYALLHRDLRHLETIRWAAIVLDEAQNIKNPGTKQARAARAIGADFRVVLTGTPVENSLTDLWSLMEFLNPGLLGREAEFRSHFHIPIQVLHDQGAQERLRRITGPFILRRLKTDRSIITDLPEKIETKEFCILTKEQATLYSAALKEIDRDIEGSEGMERRGKILGLISRLKQICNHPAQFLKDHSSLPLRSGKLMRLLEMVEELLAAGGRSLIFTQFAEMGEILRRVLEEHCGVEVLFLHGAVPKAKRDAMITRFQDMKPGSPPLFVLSLKAGGTGLNLTAASHVFHYDRWWNPAVESQATDRAYRIGQDKNVQVHKFICSGTMEERIDEMIEEKRDLAERIVGTGENWLTELSTKDLRALLALRKSALSGD
jgi:SNF2 family DNA or RNA helicase